jgi:hypothetical protein
MIRLSLKQFALACGATAKWVRNARPRLGQPIEYTDDDARWLRLARALNRDVSIPLCAAGELARRVLEHHPNTATPMPGTPMLDAPYPARRWPVRRIAVHGISARRAERQTRRARRESGAGDPVA